MKPVSKRSGDISEVVKTPDSRGNSGGGSLLLEVNDLPGVQC